MYSLQLASDIPNFRWPPAINDGPRLVKVNNKDRLLKLFFRFLIYPLITGGFAFQVSLVTSEYFRFVTITHVAVKDSLTENIPPRIHLCKYPEMDSGYGKRTLSYIFTSPKSPMS